MKRLRLIFKTILAKLEPTHLNIDKLLTASWLILAMLAVLVLTGCSSFKTQQSLPANLATKCDNPPVFEGESLGDLMLYTADVLEQYHICQAKMDAVAAWADRA